MIKLQIDNNPWKTFSQTVDGVSYDFTTQYNKRDESWWLEVGLTGKTPSVRTKMVCGFDVLAPFKYLEGVPDRPLYLIDIVKSFGRNDREGFSTRFVPYLLAEDEYIEYPV